MVAGSNDFARNLTAQRIWLEGAAPGLHQLATLSPATYSCSLVSDLSLIQWFVCMWCMEVAATTVGAQVRVSMDVSCQPPEQEMAWSVWRYICDHHWPSSWAGWQVEWKLWEAGMKAATGQILLRPANKKKLWIVYRRSRRVWEDQKSTKKPLWMLPSVWGDRITDTSATWGLWVQFSEDALWMSVCAYFLLTGFYPAQLERGTG